MSIWQKDWFQEWERKQVSFAFDIQVKAEIVLGEEKKK